MNFNKHLGLEGTHAFLSGSKYSWINYDEEKLTLAYKKFLAVQKGTDLHELAKNCIRLGVKLQKSKQSLNQFVNDAIGFRMVPEQVLFYSLNAYGTCDSISFRNNLLRIHDLKTGITPVNMNQLFVYSALFCLEYNFLPKNIDIELRIYQNGNIFIDVPIADDIQIIMNKIIIFDKKIEKIKTEESWIEKK